MSRTASRLFLAVLALSAVYALFLAGRAPANAALFEPGGLWPLSHPPTRGASLAGMLLEELLLLVGVWRLATRYFPSPKTRFFVAVAALGSSVWVDAAAPNLRLVATLPLLVSLLHDALETPSWRPPALAGSLAVLQAAGKAPVLALLTPAAAALYFAGAAVLYDYPLAARLRERGGSVRGVLGASLVIELVAVVAHVTGTPSAGEARLGRLPDLFLGISPSADVAGFCGFLTLAFAGLGLTLGRRTLAFVLLGLGALACLWSPALPLLRLGVILLSGCGFQGLLDGRFRGGGAVRSAALALAFLSLGLSALAELILADPAALLPLTGAMAMQGTDKTAVLAVQRLGLASDLPGISALMAALASGTLFLWGSGRRAAPLAIGLALFIHALDVFGWKFRMTWLNSVSLSPHALPTAPPPPPLAWTVVLGLLSLFWILAVLRSTVRILRSSEA
jgi:hypothetical protein